MEEGNEERDELQEALQRLARGNSESFEKLLIRANEPVQLEESDVHWHCYSLQLDGNCLPRTRDVARSLLDRIIDFAIPRDQIEEADRYYRQTGSTSEFERLSREADKLFTPVENSGEAGELLLFAFAESVLGLPQLVCKMDLKTSRKMHVHGSDGLHVGVDSGGLIRLYWGESKVNSSRSRAFQSCFDSISPILLARDQADVLDRQLIMRHINITDPEIAEALKRYLDPNGSDFQKVAYSGMCVVGFDYPLYPKEVNELTTEQLLISLSKDIPGWKESIVGQAKKHEVNRYHIHVLCIPMPSVDLFRNEFNAAIGAT